MKKMYVVIMFLVFLIIPLSVSAGECERYWDELCGQSFEITVDETNFEVYFSDSCYGPCPGGIAVLSYIDTQIINDIEYTAEVEIDLGYSTTPEFVIVEGLNFILIDGKLILLPDDPWIFSQIIED